MKELPITYIELVDNFEIVRQCTLLRLEYYKRFRSMPEYILLSPRNFAEVQMALKGTVYSDNLEFEGMKVLVKERGEPECAIRAKDFKQALYEDTKGGAAG